MRELTFKGFLKQYLQSLSGTDTLSMSKLIQATASGNSRLEAPLYLYARFAERKNRLINASRGTQYYEKFEKLNNQFKTEDELMTALIGDDSRLPIQYRKVYKSYQAKRNQNETNRDYSVRARDKILENLSKAGVSKYRVYTDLKLNPGNINNYLKNADATKVSRETVNQILDYSKSLVA